MIRLKKSQYKILAWCIIFLRISVPFVIWIKPFVIAMLLQVLDAVDYVLITNGELYDRKSYQLVDKCLDMYYLTALFVYSLRWGNSILIFLFIYRLIGFLIYLFGKRRKIFFFFMNIFEPVFDLYAFAYTVNSEFLTTLNESFAVVIFIVILVKFVQESYLHLYEGESMFYVFGILKKSDHEVIS